MGWAKGRYYRRQHWRGGTCHTEYIGAGETAALIAELDALDQERRAEEQREAQVAHDRFVDATRAPAEMDAYRATVRTTTREVLTALGFHQHKRQWRLQQMPDSSDAFTLAQTLYRKKRPTPDEVRRFRALLNEHTRLARVFGDQAEMARLAMLPSSDAHPIIRTAIDARCTALAHDLGREGATEIERLLIDEVVLCWLDHFRLEMHYGQQVERGELTTNMLEQWERILTSKQARYLRSIETLARVRRLLRLPSVQVNVATLGGQQVNVNGSP
jgi:hypothetical protein